MKLGVSLIESLYQKRITGNTKLNWLLQGGSHFLVIKEKNGQQKYLHVRLTISPKIPQNFTTVKSTNKVKCKR